MSTRSVITFKDEHGAHSVYRHSDGYPNSKYGVVAALAAFLADGIKCWTLPRFEADEAAAGFIATYKTGQGNYRLTSGPEAHCDIAYYYVLSFAGKLTLTVNEVVVGGWDGEPQVFKKLGSGTLTAMVKKFASE